MTALIRTLAALCLIALFSVPALGLAANLIGGSDGISRSENRALTTFPKFGGDLRAYTSDIDAYLNDNFGLRMIMIRVARKVRDNLGEDPSQVVRGKEDWLYLGQLPYRDEFEGNGAWSDGQAQDWAESFAEVKTALSEQDIPFAAVIAIDKARAYPEYLPDDWREGSRRFRTRVHALDASGSLIDAEPRVLAAKERGTFVFHKRDTHWTADATYDLAMAILDRFDPQRTQPRYRPAAPTLTPYPRLPDLDGMLGLETSQEPDKATIGFPPEGPGGARFIEPTSPDSPHKGQFRTLRYSGTLAGQPKRLVVVGDSFTEAVVKHMLPSYSEIVVIHHGAHLFDVGLDEVLAYDPDAVLFVTAERQAVTKARPFKPLKD